MNRTQQLKLLNDEIRRLFSEGIDEKSAFDQLSTDQRFESVRQTSVQSLYKKLQKDVDKEAQKLQLHDRKRMIYYQQNAKNLLFYGGPSVNLEQSVMYVWQNRYLVAAKFGRKKNDTRELNVQDLYQNISKKICFSSTDFFHGIHYLRDNFVLIDESNFTSSFFRLARIDLTDSSLRFIQKIDRYRYSHLVIDSSNSSKFLLVPNDGFNTVVVCKLVDGKIEVESEVELENVNYFAVTDTYFNGQLLMFRTNQWGRNLTNSSIIVQDLDTEKKSKTLKLEELPSNVRDCYGANVWSGDHFFLSIKFHSTDEYGVAFINPQTRKWAILEFSIDVSIGKILVDDNQDLLVCSQEHLSESYEYLLKNIYKLPMRKPELLRYKAWTKTIKLFKKKQAPDPYEEARKYLPLNSDIRGAFATDQIDDE